MGAFFFCRVANFNALGRDVLWRQTLALGLAHMHDGMEGRGGGTERVVYVSMCSQPGVVQMCVMCVNIFTNSRMNGEKERESGPCTETGLAD